MTTKEDIYKKLGIDKMHTSQHQQARNEILRVSKILDNTRETNRAATPYTIALEMNAAPSYALRKTNNEKLVMEITQWGVDNDVKIINDEPDSIDRKFTTVYYRFASLEAATMFKLTFGGEFADGT